MTNTTTTLTTREARQRLFTIDTPAADALRHKLFDVVEQDERLVGEDAVAFEDVILNWIHNKQEHSYNITMKYDTIEDQLKYLRGRVSIYKKEVISTGREYRESVQALEFYEKELKERMEDSLPINAS